MSEKQLKKLLEILVAENFNVDWGPDMFITGHIVEQEDYYACVSVPMCNEEILENIGKLLKSGMGITCMADPKGTRKGGEFSGNIIIRLEWYS